jgi:hypothetical protein
MPARTTRTATAQPRWAAALAARSPSSGPPALLGRENVETVSA